MPEFKDIETSPFLLVNNFFSIIFAIFLDFPFSLKLGIISNSTFSLYTFIVSLQKIKGYF